MFKQQRTLVVVWCSGAYVLLPPLCPDGDLEQNNRRDQRLCGKVNKCRFAMAKNQITPHV
jgi:hypothetical protein